MSYLSDFLRTGTTLKAKAGAIAIAVRDLLSLASDGRLYPAQVATYAQATTAVGANIFTPVVVSNFSEIGSAREMLTIDPSTGMIYVAHAYITANDGQRVTRTTPVTSGAAATKTVNLDTTSTATTQSPCIARLSNGNFVVVWANTGGNIKFAIIDANLSIIVPATVVDALDATTLSFHCIALSGGGFAVAYSKTNPWVAIYTNAGGVTLAASALTNAAAFGVAVTIQARELSNGNIAFAIGSGTAGKILGHAVVTAAGANVVQVTLLSTGSAVTLNDVRISALPGYYAVSHNSSGRQGVYVLSNAGALQGAPFTDTVATTRYTCLVNDGTSFWFCYPSAAGAASFNVTYAPIAGAGYVTTNILTAGSLEDAAYWDAFFERGSLFVRGYDAGYLLTPSTTSVGSFATTVSFTMSTYINTVGPSCAKPGGDFTCVSINLGNSHSVTVVRYRLASIIGVSQQAVAANNAGTVVLMNAGPGNYSCNSLIGSGGIGFDHTSNAIVGNKGVIYSDSVNLQGV